MFCCCRLLGFFWRARRCRRQPQAHSFFSSKLRLHQRKLLHFPSMTLHDWVSRAYQAVLRILIHLRDGLGLITHSVRWDMRQLRTVLNAVVVVAASGNRTVGHAGWCPMMLLYQLARGRNARTFALVSQAAILTATTSSSCVVVVVAGGVVVV